MTAAGRLGLRDHLLLIVLALAVLVPGLASIPPVDRDESRYAVASTQMLVSGDFVDPRFQDRPRHLQPAGVYWLQAAAVSALSSPEAREIWVHRMPSLVAAVIAVLLTGWTGARLFGRGAGLAAGVALAVSFSLGFEARSAKTDAALLACVLAAQLALLRIYLDPAGPRWRAALFWAATGAGMMIKGPIILLVSGSTVLALLLWDRRARWLAGLHAIWGLPLLLAIVLPWYVAIGLVSDGEFYARAVGKNLLGKVGTGQQAHAGPPGYHLALFPLAFWPASLFAVLAAPFAWRRRAEPAVRFLIAWIVPTWLIFELVATKLPHYVLPTYPAIALLAAAALFAPEPVKARWARLLGGAYALVWLLVSAVVAVLAPAVLWQMERELSLAAVVLAAVGFGLAVAAVSFLATGRRLHALASAALAGLLVWINTFGLVLPRLDSLWMSPAIARTVTAVQPCPQTLLVSTPYHEPSLVFLHGPYRTRLANTPEEAADLLRQADPCALALVGAEQRQAFLARAGAGGAGLRVVGEIAGVNYSDGEDLVLTLYAPAGTAQ